MKVLEIVYSLTAGGAERFVVDLCNELSRIEDVTLLVLKDVDQFYAPQVSDKVNVIYAKIPVGFSLKQHILVYRYIKNIKPQIVHYHVAARYSCLFANILLRKKCKFYMTIHSDVEKAYRKGVSGMQVRMAHLFGGAKFVTISKENYRQFSEIYPNYPVRMIVNGRAKPELSDRFQSVVDEVRALKSTDKTVVYIHVARCIEVKNQILLVKAFNKHIQEGANAILLIIGGGFESELGHEIRKAALPNIHFLGTRSNIYDYLACSDAFCLSSSYEGMPISVIEAVLSGLPVISTPVSGTIDAIKTGENGYITNGFTVEAYEEALCQFENTMSKVKQTAERIKDANDFNMSNCTKQYLKWFNE